MLFFQLPLCGVNPQSIQLQPTLIQSKGRYLRVPVVNEVRAPYTRCLSYKHCIQLLTMCQMRVGRRYTPVKSFAYHCGGPVVRAKGG